MGFSASQGRLSGFVGQLVEQQHWKSQEKVSIRSPLITSLDGLEPPGDRDANTLLVTSTISKDRSQVHEEANTVDFSISTRNSAVKNSTSTSYPPPPLPPPKFITASELDKEQDSWYWEIRPRTHVTPASGMSSPGIPYGDPLDKPRKRKLQDLNSTDAQSRVPKRVRDASETNKKRPTSPSVKVVSRGSWDGSGDCSCTPSAMNEAIEQRMEFPAACATSPYFRILHRVICGNRAAHNEESSLYADLPKANLEKESQKFRHLYGKTLALAFDPRLQDEIMGFIVFRYYSCVEIEDRSGTFWGKTRSKPGATRGYFQETILITSPELSAAINRIASYEPDPSWINLPRLPVPADRFYKDEQYAPYPFVFHHLTALRTMCESDNISKICTAQLLALCDYVSGECDVIYSTIQEDLAHGRVKRDYLEMIFRPNEVVISKENGANSGCVLRSYAVGGPELELYCWSWKHDGSKMAREGKMLVMKRPLQEDIEIASLDIYPARYAKGTLLASLQERGRKFWHHRKATYVTYQGSAFGGHNMVYDVATRFMIDYATYGRLHKKLYFPPLSPGPHDKWPKNLSLDMEEVQEQYILLPPNVHAFDMKEKEWRNLPIDDVEPIQWNKDAFQRLVLPKKTKDLVRALVMVRRPSQGKRENLYLFGDKNDVISGKGNGLILLLHGGPGTGKTLTAESVAELAEMPLYSVTCGDIGTTADSVEKYLHTVMYLGKTWNCVLLLDEADVFLEERTLSDLERNSLVSVFLRTLEYYDGILILTSNRIGTFDEAFKSRIQVALHYPSLDAPSRKKIWQGFLEMLAESDQDVDTEDILSHLDEIADHEMNGRQIRNVLATAHQLAIFKKQRLEWEHVELSLENAEQFNKYSRKLQGVSDTDRARDEKVRW